MKRIEVDEAKDIEWDLLKLFAGVCKKYNLKWYLGGGTLLGAIRHKGFIPWDDDVDVMMPREDYEKLLSIENLVDFIPNYISLDTYKNKKNFYPFAKFSDRRTILYEKKNKPQYTLNINIDIFPIDGVPEDDKEYHDLCERIKTLRRLLLACVYKSEYSSGKAKGVLKKIAEPVLDLIGPFKIAKAIDELAKKYSVKELNNVGCLVWGYDEREKVRKDGFKKAIEVEFEGFSYPAPSNFEEYLTNHYGNYLELPPLDKRVNHEFESYWKE